MALIRNYMKLTAELREEYGPKSLVLMQVGAFYEVYGYKDPETAELSGTNLADFSTKCELSIANKNICVGTQNVVMAGFRDYMLDKYLKKLQQLGYTTAVYSQDAKAAGTTRSLTGIYSPGTYFGGDCGGSGGGADGDEDAGGDQITNNTMCVWLQRHGKQLVCGIANIDIYTGKSCIFEYELLYTKTPDTYDELEKYVSVYNPSEVIIVHNLTEAEVENLISYADIQAQCIHVYGQSDGVSAAAGGKKVIDRIKNCEKQVYQQEILKKFFNCELFDEKFMNYTIATQSYCFLLDFVYQHNPNLVNKIRLPLFDNRSDRMLLANHSLKQLNIIDAWAGGSPGLSKKHTSVCGFLNRCVTPMGKRKFQYALLNPLTDPGVLQERYALCDYLLNSPDDRIAETRKVLQTIKDVEKLTRKLVLRRITPKDCCDLYTNLQTICGLYDAVAAAECPRFRGHLLGAGEDHTTLRGRCETVMAMIAATLELAQAEQIGTDYDTNFIKKGYSASHDTKVEEMMDAYDKLKSIANFMNDKVKLFELNKGTKATTKAAAATAAKASKTEYVKIHSTEKMGHSIVATKRRTTILKTQLDKVASPRELEYYSSYSQQQKTLLFDCGSVEFKPSTAANNSITNAEIATISTSMLQSKQIMTDSLTRIYRDFVLSLGKHVEDLESVVEFVGKLDLLYCSAYIAKKHKYCKPTVAEASEPDVSFVDVGGLRHPLIENLLTNELYVANDIQLGDAAQLGVLLYGTNAVGKSSFIKALGIAIIMAQAGFFVPAKHFRYRPYQHIFTRILGNDNLFKGLSSFAVEMVEFKTILSLAGPNSLILGDELCSGTESNSAISIFLAGLEFLYNRSSSFIFATHFHEIIQMEEVRNKPRMALKHMTVAYDKQRDKLVYDRKLRNGPGESMYGLEVCKALHLPHDFLKLAHSIRTKYAAATQSVLDYKPSRYNAKKLRGMCELCQQRISSEVHHLQHQQAADPDGFIDGASGAYFHKNHAGNLMAVCEECHLRLHKEAPQGHLKSLAL